MSTSGLQPDVCLGMEISIWIQTAQNHPPTVSIVSPCLFRACLNGGLPTNSSRLPLAALGHGVTATESKLVQKETTRMRFPTYNSFSQ